jgi:hypothetical protein
MTESTGNPEKAPARSRAEAWAAAKVERRIGRLAKEIRTFGEAHGGAEGNLGYVGARGTRIVLVGEDGAWGDLVAPSYEVAAQAVERAGIVVHESFDGEFAAKVKTGPYEWSRMAGIQIGGPANT